MLNFLKGLFTGNNDEVTRQALVAAVNDGLDLDAAITAHENWEIRLDAYLSGRSAEDLRPEVICFDDRCDLGKWIHSTGMRRLGHVAGFTELVSHHKQFHYAASNVVSLTNAGRRADAEKMLQGVYRIASTNVVVALQEMKTVVQSKHRQ